MSTNNEITRTTTTETAERLQPRPSYPPPVDVFENSEELLIVADFPGVAEQEVDVRFEKNQLSLRGPSRTRHPQTGRELQFDWARTFVLPGGVDAERISAELKHGVLKVRLPKHESLRPRQITVRAG